MLYKLHKEETESLAVGHSTVHRVHDLSSAAHGCNHVDRKKTLYICDLVPSVLWYPASLSMVCPSNDWLIDVDDPQSFVQGLYVPCCGILSLHYSRSHILDLGDWLDKTKGCSESFSQVTSEWASTNFKATANVELSLHLPQCKRVVSANKKILQKRLSSFMELLKTRTTRRLPLKQLCFHFLITL